MYYYYQFLSLIISFENVFKFDLSNIPLDKATL